MLAKRFLALVLILGLAAAAQAEEFTFKLENVGVQPLTPVFVATHDATFDIFDAGAPASPELIAIAEGGDTGPMAALAGGAAGVLDHDVGSFIHPGESTMVTVTADTAHPYLSFAAMFPLTNDGFVGVAYMDDALDLFDGGSPRYYDFTLSYLHSWDAGSEINTESAADVPALGGMGSPDEGGVITRPHPGILGIGDVSRDFDFYGLDVARVTVVPEPATLTGLALAGLVLASRRRG